MEYPTLRVKNKSRQMIDAFLGYNHNLRIGENEFYDMKNMTSDHYPVLSTRAKRGVPEIEGGVDGLLSKDELCWVKGGSFFFDGNEIFSDYLSDGPKTMVSMGAYVIILPDKVWVNTAPDKNGAYKFGEIEAEFDVEAEAGGGAYGKTLVSNCDENGNELFEDTIHGGSESAPKDPVAGDLWLDISSDPPTIKKWFSASESWGVIKTYIKIHVAGIGSKFSAGDSVMFDGLPTKQLNGLHTLHACDEAEDYVMFEGACKGVSSLLPVKATRKMPDMDFITECNNRLWGCKYRENNDGKFVNEIYASKLGDFKNWNCFDGISTDSYTASCGSDGPFTGAITHGGNPLFFKENGVHKVYGDYPANFQVQYVPCQGVQESCDKSLAIAGNTLFYKSRNAVCAYDGSMPVEISTALGNERYYNAVAGAHGDKYYICMEDEPRDGIHHLFVYDVTKGLWHKEDNIEVDSFCSHKNYLYAIDSRTKDVLILSGADEVDITESNVPWSVDSGVWGMNTADMKYISRLLIRMAMEDGARVEVSIQYDSNDLWEQVCVISATSLRSFCIPVRPKRCDHFRIRISGEGQCKIYSITKTIEQGSDIS